MTMYQSAPLDIVYFSYPPFGWLNKVLEIANFRLVFQKSGEVMLIGTELDIQEADPSVYEWTTTEELSPQGYSYSRAWRISARINLRAQSRKVWCQQRAGAGKASRRGWGL